MTTELAAALMVLAGMQIALQPPVNRALGGYVGRLPAILVSFVVGFAVLLAVSVVAGEAGRIEALGSTPPWQLLGGLCGAFFVTATALTVGRLGAAAVAAATVSGQLVGSLLVDGFGLFGLEREAISLLALAQLVPLIAGTILVTYDRFSPASTAQEGSDGKLPLLGAVFLAGVTVGFQHPLNSALADSVGGLNAGLANFGVGLLVLGLITVFSGQAGGLRATASAPRWTLSGGLLGVVIVVSSLSVIPVIGAVALTATTVLGQLTGSVVLDRFGLVGLKRRPLDGPRILGLLLLVLGMLLVLD